MGSKLENVKCEWRFGEIETIEDRLGRDKVGKKRYGHFYYEPVPECHFVLYRTDVPDALMRTSEVQRVLEQTNDSFTFETLNSVYKLTLLPDPSVN
jgi:hypothetical protein